MAAVSDNVANAETPGYSRRGVTLREAASASSGESSAMQFSGVRAVSVTRAWDAFQAADARLSASRAGRATSREQWLTAVETALGDASRDVGSLLGKFFNAGVALAANPDDRLSRSAMLAALDEATASIRATAEALTEVARGIETAAQLDTD